MCSAPLISPTNYQKPIAMKALFWLLLLLIELAVAVSSSVAQVSVWPVVTPGQGQYRCDYTITNIGSTPIDAFAIDTGDAPLATAAPAGWELQVLTLSNRRIIQWVALSPS